ncbi:hypothetical protein [Chryseobacterium sp. VAUSW3]|uniref:hypothetical protein n=1 Tax=Chryseobacterium sp. VAUSW3 TaxID=2010998 RepID=UPI000B4C83CE|nr:hypothetical protein [Chryseobacterium sp. VAUSW3]OWR13341.1 hypothetical protein CDW55_10520 [Chryseobacterium sp. VAUSW3]
MNTFLKTAKRHLAIVVDFRNYYKKPNSSGLLLLLLLFANSLYAISPGNYPASTTPAEILNDLLDGEYQATQKAVKWLATPGDVHEFNGQLGENSVLYSFIDTTMTVKRGNENVYYTVFRTSPMVSNEDGEFVNANSCHMCGVSLGYFSYTIENDSIYIQKFKRNFATHGSFGEKSYTLSMINLGDGYELLKVDDPYEGMGINSVGTKFYREGELMLSLITEENNRGNRNRNHKGYYEFNTDFAYSNKAHSITVKQTGYTIDEESGKRKNISKIRKIKVGDDSLQFQQ